MKAVWPSRERAGQREAGQLLGGGLCKEFGFSLQVNWETNARIPLAVVWRLGFWGRGCTAET